MRKISILILFLFIIPLNVLALPIGDISGNGSVGTEDYILLKKHILKMSTLTGKQLERADVNGDSKITSHDYIIIRKMILGFDVSNLIKSSLKKICQGNSSTIETLNTNEEVIVGLVDASTKEWYINGDTDKVKISSGSTRSELNKGQLPIIKGVKTGVVQVVAIKNDGKFYRCTITVLSTDKETGWKGTIVNGKIEWRYYNKDKKAYYKNTRYMPIYDYFYFDSNGYLIRNKELTYNGNKYSINSIGLMNLGCVNGKYYNPYRSLNNNDANYGVYQKTCTDTSLVTKVNAKTLSIETSKKSIQVGEKIRLTAKFTPFNVNVATKWSSSKSDIVTVNDYGIIEGIKEGSSVITAKNGSITATVKITVSGTLNMSYQSGISSDGVINNSTFGIIKNASSKANARKTTEGINKALKKAKDLGVKEVKLEPGVYVVDMEHYVADDKNVGIKIPDGVTLNLNGSVIKAYANNLHTYAIVYFNVTKTGAGIKNGIVEGDISGHKCLDGTLLKDSRKCFLEASHERTSGIRIYNAKNVTIENIEIYNVPGDGINVGSSTDSTENIVIKNNNIHNNGRQGITISCAKNVSITNNMIHDIYGYSPESAIDLESSGEKDITKISITNNKFYNIGYYYNQKGYDILLASKGHICDVKITNNEYVYGVHNNNKYINGQCKASNKLDISGNKTISFK